jgi:chromosome transmission fidelity protein 4
VLKSLLTAQQQDLVDFTKASHSQRTALARMELEIDKTLLQMMAVECREGEDRGMRALEMVSLMRDRTGRMIEAAGKVAARYGRSLLEEKIREVGEAKLLSGEEED